MVTSEGNMRVFVSYCHVDRDPWLDRLLVHLKPLTTAFGIEVFSDRSIDVGEQWFRNIEEALNTSQVAILLISADFLASDFINKEELPRILADAQGRGLLILPVVISSCSFQGHQKLLEFQAVNFDSPLDQQSKGEQEAIFRKVAERVGSIGRAYEIARVKGDVEAQKVAMGRQQELINQLVMFSMSWHIFAFLRDFANNKYSEFLYRSSEHKDLLRFLRDNGFIEMIHLRELRELDNLVGRVIPTPIGRSYVELRERIENTARG